MGKEIEADYGQQFLLPPSLEDWVPADHPARFIRAFVDTLDLGSLGVDWNDSPAGRPTYGARLLLSLWLYGYFCGERSTRKLEAACREHMGLVWLAGMHTPDHNTLWRFFDRNRLALRNVFTESVRVAARADMVGMALHAVDGTKLGARAATRGRLTKEELEDLASRADAAAQDWEDEIEATADPDGPGTGLPEELRDETKLRNKIQEALDALEQDDKLEQIHPDDPDARVMKCSHLNANRLAYNGQAVADDKHGILVAQDLSNQAFDQHQLTPMLDAVEQTAGGCAATTLADGGYCTVDAVADAYEAGRDVLVSLPSRIAGKPGAPYHASHFTYDPDTDTLTCPKGQTLPHVSTRPHRGKGHHLNRYRCATPDCPVKNQCASGKRPRQVEYHTRYPALARQKQRQRAPGAKALLARRAPLIESVFGHIKHNMGFDRFTRHGIEKAKTEWALICTAYNLQKIFRRLTQPTHDPKRLNDTPATHTAQA